MRVTFSRVFFSRASRRGGEEGYALRLGPLFNQPCFHLFLSSFPQTIRFESIFRLVATKRGQVKRTGSFRPKGKVGGKCGDLGAEGGEMGQGSKLRFAGKEERGEERERMDAGRWVGAGEDGEGCGGGGGATATAALP